MQAISTDKPVSQNYAVATESARVVQLFHFWSGTKYFQTEIPLTFMEMDIPQNAGFTKGLRIAFVMCYVNSE